ncbi:MAG: CDP-4-keto-6-deoxy-D-glucose-3-dehydrase [Bdellovibrionales bacterium RIFOXYD1_FULL_53_11]|nr:MAG: CDP-4-keto-6-deoxy-D-glucose-3-dehydrase [Bdellovibrionales bacterium RIFOXYD1_FULL_53_11]
MPSSIWKLQDNILENDDKELLIRFIQSTDRFTQFEKVKLFEKEWCGWQKCRYSTFVNSGSSADLVMLDAVKEYYGIPDGAEVLVPAVTWTTNITSVVQTRLVPVFVDINLTDLSFDYDKLQKAVTSKTRIILVTHLIGVPADIALLKEFAEHNKLIILEDCCESHGATFKGTKVGNFGVAGTFSFYWGHHLTTVEGGMICTENEELNDLFMLKRSHGLARELAPSKHQKYKDMYPGVDFNFLFLTHGYNFRNTELHAVLGVEQLKHLDRYIDTRNRNYREFLKVINPISDKLHVVMREGMSSFCLPFVFKTRNDKDRLHNALVEAGIEHRPIIGGNLLRQPCFERYGNFRDFPSAEIVHLNGFYIGNNQFVDGARMQILAGLITDIF